MKFFGLFLGIILSSNVAFADVALSIGAGKSILAVDGSPFERALAIGYQKYLSPDLFIRPEAGYFVDLSGQGRKSSLWFAPVLGMRALSRVGTELHIGAGPGYLQNPDTVLGGHFQFSLEGGMGIADKKGQTYIGIAWKHLSSAGFEMPNNGRDLIVVQLRLMGL